MNVSCFLLFCPTFAALLSQLIQNHQTHKTYVQRKQRRSVARHSSHCSVLVLCFLYSRVRLCETSFVQSLNRGYHTGNALCQQSSQQTAGDMGARHQVLFQTNLAYGRRVVRFQADIPAGSCHWPACRHSRHYHRMRHTSGRHFLRQAAEDGRTNGTDDFDGKCHLRRSCRAGS